MSEGELLSKSLSKVKMGKQDRDINKACVNKVNWPALPLLMRSGVQAVLKPRQKASTE